MRVAIVVLGVLLCSAATADPQPWMKKENPETLSAVVAVGIECPFTETEAKEVVHGVLIRSRLRPRDWSTETLFIGVAVDCLETTNSGLFIYDADVSFFRWEFSRMLEEVTGDYSNFGIGRRADILGSIRESVEGLVTDYLQANFDLAPE